MRIFATLFSGLLIISLITSGCSKSNPTSVDTLRVHDTLNHHDTLTHRDTVHTGPAFVRFLAFLNSNQTITLKTMQGSSLAPFASAPSQSSRLYLPIRGDTVLDLYASFYSNFVLINSPPFTVPAVGSATLFTISFFETAGPSLIKVFSVDPVDPPPHGFGYFRLIDAISDFPTPSPQVEAYLDALTNTPIFVDSSSHAPIYLTYQQISAYVLIPAGPHTLLVKGEGGSTPDYSAPLNVTDGAYYTARLIGSRTMSTDRLFIDAE
jgi:hypothetical protein